MARHLPRFVLENHPYHTVSATVGRMPVFADEAAAQVVVDAINFLRGDKAFVLAFAVMPDHLHALFVPKAPWTISQVMQTLKGYVSREVNLRNGTSGPLWQRSYYDRVIRDETQLAAAIEYIEGNPVSAGLTGNKEAFRFSSAWVGVETDLGAWSES